MKTDVSDLVVRLEEALRKLPRVYADEYALQDALECAFLGLGLNVQSEVELTARSRIDFVLEQRFGVEVKVDGSLTDVTRQILRYANVDQVEAIILVTTRQKHRAMPSEMRGKPVHVLYINPL